MLPLEQRTTVGGKPSSIERLVAMDLRAEPATGNLLANGPGWVRRAWVDTGNGAPRMPGAPPTAPPRQPAPQSPAVKRLVYLGVNFQGLLAGNQTQQAMDFQDRVRCVYSPIPDWDSVVEPDDPDKLADGAILLTSDRLQVVRTAAVTGQGQPFELTATGNAKLDGRAGGSAGDPADPSKPKSRGQTFSASAARLNYAAAKDLFVLEGDGRNYAYLARQERVGARSTSRVPVSSCSGRRSISCKCRTRIRCTSKAWNRTPIGVIGRHRPRPRRQRHRPSVGNCNFES